MEEKAYPQFKPYLENNPWMIRPAVFCSLILVYVLKIVVTPIFFIINLRDVFGATSYDLKRTGITDNIREMKLIVRGKFVGPNDPEYKRSV